MTQSLEQIQRRSREKDISIKEIFISFLKSGENLLSKENKSKTLSNRFLSY